MKRESETFTHASWVREIFNDGGEFGIAKGLLDTTELTFQNRFLTLVVAAFSSRNACTCLISENIDRTELSQVKVAQEHVSAMFYRVSCHLQLEVHYIILSRLWNI